MLSAASPHSHVVSPLKYPHFFLCSVLQVYPVLSLFRHLQLSQGLSCPVATSLYRLTEHACAFSFSLLVVVVVYPLPWPLLVGGVRCSRLWSTSQLLRPSGQQCSHSGGVCPQIQGRQCGAYVGAVEEMMCVVCVDVTEGA